MPLTVLQNGTTLQLLDNLGGLQTLTLPTDVTLRTDVNPRFAVYNQYVVIVNTPSRPITVDAAGVVRLLTPNAPRLAPILAGNGVSTLSGIFRARMTNRIVDLAGNVISESDFSPTSNPATIANQFLQASGLDISPDQINQRVLYRTTDNGAVYFEWVDVDGNVITSIQDDLSDAGLSIFAAPILGNPPRLTTIAQFRNRLFGTGDVDIDSVRYTETGLMYSWPSDNLIAVPGKGIDEFGVVGLIPRREALGIGRRNLLAQVTGTGIENADGLPDFDMVILSKELGIESQESVQVFRDTAYFLWKDGVYQWGSEGIKCISDGKVRTWFVTDDFFNRDQFPNAFAHIDPDHPHYRLFLCSAGSNVIDSWVEYDINDQTWWGPHSTGAFTPSSAFVRTNAANQNIPVIGSASDVWIDQATRTDGPSTGIDFDVIGKRHDGGAPDQDKMFGELSILGKAQSSGVLDVISRTGDVNATQALTQEYDMTKPRKRLGRLGHGKHAQIELTNDNAGVDVEIYGYEIDPVTLIGRR